jgi:LmbE family N-acetylglucosaminyl deacetylase
MPRTVIVSPHFDDAALSCWHVLSSPGEVSVVNVFAAAPPAGSRPGWWDHRLGPPEVAVQRRAEEDRRALAHAGRSARNLSFVDAQYRSGERPPGLLAAALEAEVPDGATVYAPASLGLHPDHDAVRSAALELRDRGARVVLYADVPHAGARGWPPWVVGAGGDERIAQAWERALRRSGLAPDSFTPVASRLEGDSFERKLAAVREYESQMPALEALFGRRIDDPELLGYEVEWGLPSSSASAPVRNPADNA